PLAPALAQRHPAPTTNVYSEDRAGHSVKPGGEDDGVGCVFPAPHLDTARRDALDRSFAYVDEPHVRSIEGLEIADVDAQTLATDGVLRRQQLSHHRVAHLLADLLAHELGGSVVGCLVHHQVLVGAEEGKAAALPALLVFARTPSAGVSK